MIFLYFQFRGHILVLSVLLICLANFSSKWILKSKHCAKSVCIRSYSGPHFPAFGLKTERYEVSLRIQSKCEKIRTRINLNTNTFQTVKAFVLDNFADFQKTWSVSLLFVSFSSFLLFSKTYLSADPKKYFFSWF